MKYDKRFTFQPFFYCYESIFVREIPIFMVFVDSIIPLTRTKT